MGKKVHSQETWDKIKKEYIMGKDSMRTIALKYGIAVSAISDRCKKEGWNTAREKIQIATEQKMIDRISDQKASNAELAENILNKLMQKLSLAVEVINPVDVQATKQITQCMKDLADMGVYSVQKAEDNKTIKLETDIDQYAE